MDEKGETGIEDGSNQGDPFDPRDYKSVTHEGSALAIYSLYLNQESISLSENRDLLGLGAGIAEAEIALGGYINSEKITLVDKRSIATIDKFEKVERVKEDFVSYLNNGDNNKYGFITFFGAESLLENLELKKLLEECDKKISDDGIIIISPIPYEWRFIDTKEVDKNGYKEISNLGIESILLVLQKKGI